MAKELFAGRRKRGTAFVADEKRPPKLLLQVADSRADRRLSDIQTFCSPDEAPG